MYNFFQLYAKEFFSKLIEALNFLKIIMYIAVLRRLSNQFKIDFSLRKKCQRSFITTFPSSYNFVN